MGTIKSERIDFRKNNFDLIRLLAASQVVLAHGFEHFGIHLHSFVATILYMFPGVPIFFVISGFLISASLERSKSHIVYFINRFLRIYPGLWICFFVSVVSIYFLYHPVVSVTIAFKWILAQLTIGQFYNPSFLRGYSTGVLNGSLWTIPVEVQFYLLLPVIYYLLNRIRWNSVVVWLFFSVLILINCCYVINVFGETERSFVMKFAGVSIFPYLYLFFWGVLLQRNINFIQRFIYNKTFLILLLYVCLAFIARFAGMKYTGNLMNPISALLLGVLVISSGYSFIDIYGIVIKRNDLSYGFYIYHMVVVNAVLFLSPFVLYVNLLLMLLVTALLATMSWFFVEKPCLNLKKFTIKK